MILCCIACIVNESSISINEYTEVTALSDLKITESMLSSIVSILQRCSFVNFRISVGTLEPLLILSSPHSSPKIIH